MWFSILMYKLDSAKIDQLEESKFESREFKDRSRYRDSECPMMVWISIEQEFLPTYPKSHSFTTPPFPRRIFWGFISLWRILWECR